MANNKTDYNKPFSNIFELLPNVFRSDVSRALMENGFNRFVTKPEMEDVVGIVGEGDTDLKITEIDSHRQANQLQPLIYNKIATVDHIASFKDLLRESARLGVDTSKFDEWGQSTRFNFAPPVDLDKIVNWRDYYWLSDTNPQYITIKNRSRKVNTIIEQGISDNSDLRELVDLYRTEDDPIELANIEQQIEDLYPGFVLLLREQTFIRESNPVNRVNPDGWDAIDWDPLINGEWGNPFEGLQIQSATPSSFYVDGDFTQLFNLHPMFEFEVIDSAENSGVYQVALSLYDDTLEQTQIFVNGGGVDDTVVDGKIAVSNYDLEEFDPFVDGNYDKDDGTTDNEVSNPGNFLLQNDPWSQQNFWVHLSDIPSGVNLSLIRRATQPIIEYNEFLLLNEWSYTKQNWAYNSGTGFGEVGVVEPTREEIFSYDNLVFPVALLDAFNGVVVLDEGTYPDVADIFSEGMEISLEVIGSFEFRYFTITRVRSDGSGQFQIHLDQSPPTSLTENDVRIHGIRRTSQGDDWKGFFFHWAHISQSNPVPVDRQQLNRFIVDGTQVEEQPATGTSTVWYRLNDTSFVPNNDEIRVYVNGIRQYGNFLEGYWDGSQYTTEIPEGENGNAIRFLSGVGSGTIRIETGPAADIDRGLSSVFVRTSTRDNFVVERKSVVRYRVVEQQKIEQTQYPLFDIFNLDGTTAYRADALWKFKEDGSFNVNVNLNKRVVNQGNVFTFEQTLLDYDDGPMYAYRERDGELHTIWRKGLNDETYTPRYINSDGDVTSKTDPDGDWEIPQQMTNNLEHQNRRELTTTDVFQHFKSIIESQANPPGYTSDATNRWRVLNNINYGVGGSINEFNDGFDTFISATFVRDVTVPTLLQFVRDRYENQHNLIRNRFQSDIDELLTITSLDMADIQTYISEYLINVFENNARRDVVFGDSTTFDSETNTGMRGWIATMPYIGLTKAVQPKILIDENLGLLEITHHDGHITTPSFDNGRRSTMISNILKKDNAVSGTSSERLDVESAPLGQIFFDTDRNVLSKFIVVRRGVLQPRDVPMGSLWYDTANNQLKRRVNTPDRFEVVSNQMAWQEIDLDLIYANVVLEVEQRLYDNVPQRDLSYDLSNVQSDTSFNNLEQREFIAYAKQFNIVNPFTSDYNASNAFTWNYSNISVSDIRLNTVPQNWTTQGVPARWYDIYKDVYGTRYPHLEPWVLQGYESRPDWWYEEYPNNGTRRWSQQMWTNIISTIVPAGREYATGAVSIGSSTDGILNGGLRPFDAIPVNVTDQYTQDMRYAPDDLLPPYFNSSDPADIDILGFGQLVTSPPLMSDARQPYPFGTNGPMEDTWRRSSSYNYDLAEIAFLIDPVRFVHRTFGNDFVEIDGLTVDTNLNKVFSHRDTQFHGEIVNNTPYRVNGMNQWFVNYIRFNSYDLETADFKSMWLDWRPRLSYQTGSFVDTNSLSLATDSQFFDNSDFEVLTKKTLGLVDAFADALMMVVNQVGAHRSINGVRIPDGDGSDWRFRITTPNPSIRDVTLYGVNTSSEEGTFQALRGQTTNQTWSHYTVDKSTVLTFTPGDIVDTLGSNYQGIQGLINFIDGYSAFLKDAGFTFGTSEFAIFDGITGRTMSWQVETEKMIDTIYNGMASDQLPVEFFGLWNYAFADMQANVFRVSGNQTLKLRSGDQVQMSTTGNLPAPFKRESIYYVTNIVDNTFQLAQVRNGAPINIQTMGQGIHSVGMNRFEASSPTTLYEINPFRNQILIDHEIGVLSNVHDGSFVDIRNTQGVYDQYGRPLKQHQVNVFRRDKQSRILIEENISNDVIVSDPIDPEGRNLLHMGGVHVFMDGYEHTILLNRRTIEGNLLFDQFLGSSIRRINMGFRRQANTTFRPNVGGYVVDDDTLRLNFEGSVEQIQHLYDAHLADENSEATKAARNLIGFERKDYFDNMGVTPKSQLLFHRGMIQHKGSTNAVKAFINSKRFIDASVDEFWAYKVSEYGDNRKEVYPELSLRPRDTNNDKLMLNFVVGESRPIPNFIDISLDDTSRWYNHPEQIRNVFGDDPNLFFDAEVTDMVNVTGTQALSAPVELPVIVDGVKIVVNQREGYGQYIVPDNSGMFTFDMTVPIVPQTDCLSVIIKRDGVNYPNQTYNISEDGASVTIQALRMNDGSFSVLQQGDLVEVSINNAILIEGIHYELLNARNVSFDVSTSVFDLSMFDDVKVYCLNVAKTKINPVKMIDQQAGVNIQTIPIWDPARNHHYHTAENIVSYQDDVDPAFYTHSLVDNNIDVNRAWKSPFEKLVWWDTTKRDYVPYYDKAIFPSVDVRTSEWGRLAQYGKIELFEWISSPVPPSDYASYIEEQDGEITGQARLKLYARERNAQTQQFDQPWFVIEDVIHKLWGYQATSTYDVSTVFENGDELEVYVNGFLREQRLTVVSGIVDLSFASSKDTIVLIKPQYEPSEEELEFDPEVEDDEEFDIQYRMDADYVKVDTIAPNGIDIESVYYFWATQTGTSHDNLTIRRAEQQLASIPTPFVLFQNLVPSELFDNGNSLIPLQDRYTQAIFRGLVNTVNTPNRFYLRFVKNFTLRDDYEDADTGLRQRHTEWQMIRERQKFNIPRVLWNKLTEAVSGRTLSDNPVPVPSLNRTLYDEEYGTTLRFGLRDGQSLVPKQRGIDVIVKSIEDPNFDLYPIDRDEFLANFKFDTPENIELAMETIYTTFLPEHINRIWFAALYEGMANNIKYTDIFKTSWIQLDGVRLLDTSGVLE